MKASRGGEIVLARPQTFMNLSGEAVKKLAQEHINLARSVGVTGTPTYFINGKLVVGADFQQIEKLIKEAGQTSK